MSGRRHTSPVRGGRPSGIRGAADAGNLPITEDIKATAPASDAVTESPRPGCAGGRDDAGPLKPPPFVHDADAGQRGRHADGQGPSTLALSWTEQPYSFSLMPRGAAFGLEPETYPAWQPMGRPNRHRPPTPFRSGVEHHLAQ
jgi:hypothetical protein